MKNNKRAMTAKQSKGLYIVTHISSDFHGTALAAKSKFNPAIEGIHDYYDNDGEEISSEPDTDDSEPEGAQSKADRHLYRLMHRPDRKSVV